MSTPTVPVSVPVPPITPALTPPSNDTFTFNGGAIPTLNFSQKPPAQPTKVPDSLNVVDQPWVNTRFSEKDSDVQIRSSDGVTFRLHRSVLEMSTGAFPGPEVPTEGEPVSLTEPAKVLAILFSFVYPKRHPDLEGLDFQVVAAVAEAAGKYEVFSAMIPCNACLMKFLPEHALDIFAYAVKHDHHKLRDEAVPHLTRLPLVTVLKELPPRHMLAWSRYHEAWQGLFRQAAIYIKNMSAMSSSEACHDLQSHTLGKVCHACRCGLYTLLTELEALAPLSSLNNALKDPGAKYPSLPCCSRAQDSAPCRHVPDLVKFIQRKISDMPTYSSFLSKKD